MICPKCGHENEPGSQDCLLCGVIFAKIKQRLAPVVPVPEIGVDRGESSENQEGSALDTGQNYIVPFGAQD